MAFEAERVNDYPGRQPNDELVQLNLDGRPFADLYIRPEDTTLGWPGEIPASQLEHEVLRTIPEFLGCEPPLGSKSEESVLLNIITSDARLLTLNGLTVRGLGRYHHLLEKQTPGISFARFDVTAVREGIPTKYAVTERPAKEHTPPDLGELTLTVARDVEWSDELLQWVLNHHASLVARPEAQSSANPKLARELGETMLRFLCPETSAETLDN